MHVRAEGLPPGSRCYLPGVSILERLDPKVSRRTRLFLAALLWTGIGTGLLVAGLHWLLGARAAWLGALPIALLAGWIKGRLVLAPRVSANALRIVEAGDGRCVGGVFSWGSWGIAVVMMAGGIALRHSPLPRPWLGLLYCTIGAALLAASLESWARWREFVRDASDLAR